MIIPGEGVYNLSCRSVVSGVLESLYATLSHYYATIHNGQFCCDILTYCLKWSVYVWCKDTEFSVNIQKCVFHVSQ